MRLPQHLKEITEDVNNNMTFKELLEKYQVPYQTMYAFLVRSNLCCCPKKMGEAIVHTCKRIRKDEGSVDLQRYKVIVGELEAGNNSRELLNELKLLILRMNASNHLSSNDLKNIMMHILMLGL